MHTHRSALAFFVSTLLFLLSACGGSPPPTQTPYIIVVTAPPGPGVSAGLASPTAATATNAPTRPPTGAVTVAATDATVPTLPAANATPTEVKLTTYSGSGAPFSVQYPSDWTAVDHEQSQKLVVMTAPDQQSSLQLIYGTAGTLSTDELLQTFLSNFAVPALKTSNHRRNVDGSMSVDLQYNDSSGSPLAGVLRLVHLNTSANFYVIIYSATPERYAQTKTLGLRLLNSFTERTSSVRQPTATRPSATSTVTPFAPTATDTPEPPTDTPLPPPPTDTPRPVVAAFRIDAQARGYENWGYPTNGCDSYYTTGQYDYNHPVKRLTIDLIITNNSGRPIQASDVTYGMFSDTGTSLLGCQTTGFPTVPARGSSNFGLTTFIEKNQFLSALRMSIFGASVRVCFGRNNPPSVVGCG